MSSRTIYEELKQFCWTKQKFRWVKCRNCRIGAYIFNYNLNSKMRLRLVVWVLREVSHFVGNSTLECFVRDFFARMVPIDKYVWYGNYPLLVKVRNVQVCLTSFKNVCTYVCSLLAMIGSGQVNKIRWVWSSLWTPYIGLLKLSEVSITRRILCLEQFLLDPT